MKWIAWSFALGSYVGLAAAIYTSHDSVSWRWCGFGLLNSIAMVAIAMANETKEGAWK